MISSVVIIVLIIVFIVLGFFRGAARTLLNLAAMAASAVISHFLGSYLAQAAYDTFLKNNIIAHLQSNAGEYGVDYTAHNSISALPSGVQNLLNGFTRLFGVSSGDLQGRFVVQENTPAELARAVEKPIGDLTVFIMSTLFTCLVFILLWVVFKLLIRKALLVFRIPVVRQLNMILGGFLGLLEGVIFVFFVANILYVAVSCANPQLAENSTIFGGLFNALLIFK